MYGGHHAPKFYEVSSTINLQKRGIKNLDFFSHADKKNYSIVIKFCSLVEDGVCSVIPSFEEI